MIPGVTLRSLRVGDMGWIVHRQALLYEREYGWGVRFEALVARVAADFMQQFDAQYEQAWVAERGGEVVGAVFLTKVNERTAKLRMLYVEPSTRGLGLGRHLVQSCIAGARARGYQTMTLWTNAVLTAARAIYVAEGFTLVHSEVHELFGPQQVGETWELVL